MKLYRLENARISGLEPRQVEKKALTWIRSINPDDEEMRTLVKLSGIPIEEFREAREEDERPRLTRRKYIEIIYDAPHDFRGEGLQTMEIYFYIAGNLVITIEEEPSKVLNRLEARCREGKGKAIFRSHGLFLTHVLEEINEEFLLRIDRVARSMDAIRERRFTKVDLASLYAMSMTFAYFNQAIIANLEVLKQLRKLRAKPFTQHDLHGFNELYIDKLHILDTEKIQRELVMHLINIQSIISTEDLNRTTKRLTALAVFIALPTLITSMYGMNVPLPLAHSEHAFWTILVGTVVVSLLLLFVMRKMKWV